MKLEHLGKITEIEPQQAAIEVRIVRMLNKHGAGVRQNKLCQLTNSQRFGTQAFEQALNRLIDEENIVRRSATTNSTSFLLKLTPWGEQQAEDLEEMLSERKAVVAQSPCQS